MFKETEFFFEIKTRREKARTSIPKKVYCPLKYQITLRTILPVEISDLFVRLEVVEEFSKKLIPQPFVSTEPVSELSRQTTHQFGGKIFVKLSKSLSFHKTKKRICLRFVFVHKDRDVFSYECCGCEVYCRRPQKKRKRAEKKEPDFQPIQKMQKIDHPKTTHPRFVPSQVPQGGIGLEWFTSQFMGLAKVMEGMSPQELQKCLIFTEQYVSEKKKEYGIIVPPPPPPTVQTYQPVPPPEFQHFGSGVESDSSSSGGFVYSDSDSTTSGDTTSSGEDLGFEGDIFDDSMLGDVFLDEMF